jgi:hypothetical protein
VRAGEPPARGDQGARAREQRLRGVHRAGAVRARAARRVHGVQVQGRARAPRQVLRTRFPPTPVVRVLMSGGTGAARARPAPRAARRDARGARARPVPGDVPAAVREHPARAHERRVRLAGRGRRARRRRPHPGRRGQGAHRQPRQGPPREGGRPPRGAVRPRDDGRARDAERDAQASSPAASVRRLTLMFGTVADGRFVGRQQAELVVKAPKGHASTGHGEFIVD